MLEGDIAGLEEGEPLARRRVGDPGIGTERTQVDQLPNPAVLQPRLQRVEPRFQIVDPRLQHLLAAVQVEEAFPIQYGGSADGAAAQRSGFHLPTDRSQESKGQIGRAADIEWVFRRPAIVLGKKPGLVRYHVPRQGRRRTQPVSRYRNIRSNPFAAVSETSL